MPRWWMTLLLLLALPGWATVFRSGDRVVISRDQVIADDLVVSGGTVEVLGRVTGDVVAAGGNVTVSGPVGGAVIAAGGTVTVTGAVAGSAYLTGGTIVMNGPVARNAVVAGGTTTLNQDATVGRDLTVAAGDATVRSRIGRNVQAQAGTLSLGDTARVDGDLRATVGSSAIATGAVIAGQRQVTRTPQGHRDGGPWGWILGGLLGGVMLLLAGLVFVGLAPRLTEETETTLRTRPGMSALAGLVLLLIGIPLAFIWLWIYLSAVFISPIFLAILVGRLVWRRPGGSLFLALLIGVALLVVVQLIPVVGFLVTLGAWLFGLGALALALYDRSRHRRAERVVAPEAPPQAPPDAPPQAA